MKPAFVTPGSARTSSGHACRTPRASRQRAVLRHRQRRPQRQHALGVGSRDRSPAPSAARESADPADTSSTTDATISATTSAERSRSFCPPPARAPSRRPSESGFAGRRAATGARPNAMPVSAVSPTANSSTRRSTVGVLGDRQRRRHEPRQQRHRRTATARRARRRRRRAAGSRSSAAAPAARGRRRSRCAPPARGGGSSARASSRLARLAQAISSTHAGRAAQREQQAARDRWRHLVAQREHQGADVLVLAADTAAPARAAIDLASRPRLLERDAGPQPPDRLQPVVGAIRRSSRSVKRCGVQNSASLFGNWNSRGITPMTVYDASSSDQRAATDDARVAAELASATGGSSGVIGAGAPGRSSVGGEHPADERRRRRASGTDRRYTAVPSTRQRLAGADMFASSSGTCPCARTTCSPPSSRGSSARDSSMRAVARASSPRPSRAARARETAAAGSARSR